MSATIVRWRVVLAVMRMCVRECYYCQMEGGSSCDEDVYA